VRRLLAPAELWRLAERNRLLVVWKNISDPRLLARHAGWLAPRLVRSLWRADAPTAAALRELRGLWPRVRASRAAALAQAVRTDREVLALWADY
jgi:hypothetical protein